jgi:3-deoxy-manno-octulosonate cytidylyltransferase (CMP-KDO synthetase)
MSKNSIIIIPARLASTRLPNKPLLDIAGKPMIIRVVEQAQKSGVGEVVVACGDQQIFDLVEAHSFSAVMTDPNLASGSDRVYAAYKQLNLKHEFIINLQGDLPTVSPELIIKINDDLISSKADIATAAAKITDTEEKHNPNVAKAVIGFNMRALYFTRSACPWGEGDLYHHIGIYGYKKEALERYVNFPPSPLEKRERLEQLRALENGLSISVSVVDSIPIGVDTKEDLEAARKVYINRN